MSATPASGGPTDNSGPAASDDRRTIDLEVEVPGTPEQVWRAIATGPGISSWYVPHTVEERAGGAVQASFGPGPEMQISGRVLAWQPPHRVVFDGGEPDSDAPAEGMAFEWLVEARDGGSCIVRLVNSGFGSGAEWDDQYDQMTEGWRLFLTNLRLHLTHFPGQSGFAVLPTAQWTLPRSEAWSALTRRLGLPSTPAVGERVQTSGDSPQLAGTVLEADATRLALLLDSPAPGTAFFAAEGPAGGPTGISVWSYVYGPHAAELAERADPAWRSWLETAEQ